jgi:MFS family permease
METKDTGLLFILRALKHKNYRLFFFGQIISLVGTWMQSIATSWLIYQMTGSEFLLGLITFAGQIPSFIVAPLGGVIADRWNRHHLIILTQTLSMIQALALTVFYFTHILSVPVLITLVALLGVINGFDMPIRQAFLLDMVEKKEDLLNAVALNSSVFNGARLVGPSVAGLLVATVGEGVCFLINGLSYIAVIAALLLMTLPHKPPKKDHKPVLQGFIEGFRYAAGFWPIRTSLLIIGLICITPLSVLLPVFAKTVLHGGPHTFGFLVGALGLGAFIGAIFLASRPDSSRLGTTIALGAAVYGLGLVSFSFSHIFWISLALMVLVGFGMMITMSSGNTMIQTIAEDDKRGRVMSFYAMAITGTAPLGSLLGGILAGAIGTPYTYLLSGLACIIGAFFVSFYVTALNHAIQNATVLRPLSAESIEISKMETDSLLQQEER